MSVYVRDKSLIWGGLTKGVAWLFGLNILIYFGEWFIDLQTWEVNQSHSRIFYFFSLSSQAVLEDFSIWQIFSYMFLHDNFMHLFLNMLCLLLLGPETERYMATKHFLIMYFFSGMLGAAGWILTHGTTVPGFCVGSSGALLGVFGAFVALFPKRRVYIILFPMWPIRSWILALALLILHLVFYFCGWLRVAWDVHIAGGLAGFIYTLTVFNPKNVPWGWPKIQQAFKNKTVRKLMLQRSEEEATVDDLLDKVEREGMDSLTADEREIIRGFGTPHSADL